MQRTVKQLKAALEKADDNSVVGLSVPKVGIGYKDLSVVLNLKIRNTIGPVVVFEPLSQGDISNA